MNPESAESPSISEAIAKIQQTFRPMQYRPDPENPEETKFCGGSYEVEMSRDELKSIIFSCSAISMMAANALAYKGVGGIPALPYELRWEIPCGGFTSALRAVPVKGRHSYVEVGVMEATLAHKPSDTMTIIPTD